MVSESHYIYLFSPLHVDTQANLKILIQCCWNMFPKELDSSKNSDYIVL
jgi:hypothetical protein